MPSGSQDFNAQPTATPTSNAGEAPNRLLMGGGSNSQSGRWLWASGFESGLAEWTNASTPPKAILTTTSGFVYQGAQGLQLQTSGVINDVAFIEKRMYAQGSRFGLECMFAIVPTNTQTFEISIEGPATTAGRRSFGAARIFYDSGGPTCVLNLSTGAGSPVVTGLYNTYISNTNLYHHYFKLSFDTRDGSFLRCLFDDLVFDLSAISAGTFANTRKYYSFKMALTSGSANQDLAWIDNVVITADEP